MRRPFSIIVVVLLGAVAAVRAEPPAAESFEITGHKGVVAFAGFSADSKVLTTIDEGGLVRRWDACTGKLLSSRADAPLPFEYQRGTEWDAGGRLHRGMIEKFFSARSFAADGSAVAGLTKEGTIRLRDLTTGKERELQPGAGSVFAGVALSPDGRVLATWAAGGKDLTRLATLQFWDATTGKLLRTADRPRRVRDMIDFEHLREPYPPRKMAFTPDGKTLVTAAEEVRFWDVATGRERAGNSFYRGSGEPWTVSFSLDGKVAIGVVLGEVAWTQVFDTTSGKQLAFLSLREDMEAGPGWFLSGGRMLATQKSTRSAYAEDVVQLWDVRNWENTVRLDGQFVAASPDGKVVLTLMPEGRQEHKLLTAWNAETGARLRQLSGDWFPRLPGAWPGTAFVFSPDGSRLAALEVRDRKRDEMREIDPAHLVVRVVRVAGPPWRESTPPAAAPPPRLVVRPVVPAFPREVVLSEADRVLRAMDARIASARTLRIEYAVESPSGIRFMQGTLLVAEENRFRNDVKVVLQGPMLSVSDGQQLFARPTRFGLEDAAFARMPMPDGYTEMLQSLIGLRGIEDSLETTPWWFFGGPGAGKENRPRTPRPTNAKLLPDERVNGVKTRVVQYDLSGQTVRLWIDVKTGLPLRRMIVASDRFTDMSTETYTKFELNPKLDDNLFELPEAPPRELPREGGVIAYALSAALLISSTVEAELLLREVDATIAAAKTLRIEYTLGFQMGGGAESEGALLLGEGNRVRHELKAKDARGKVRSLLFVLSDGKEVVKDLDAGTAADSGRRSRMPEWHNAVLRSWLGLGGNFFSEMAMSAEIDLANQGTGGGKRPGPNDGPRTVNVTLLPDEQVNGVRARVVEYDLSWRALPPGIQTGKVRVWIDARTKLPLRRTVGDMLAETYTKFEIDSKLDDKLFVMPK